MKTTLIKAYDFLYYLPKRVSYLSLSYGMRKENKNIVKIIENRFSDKEIKILDIGCGYGRMLKLLSSNGYKPIGIDVNHEIVRKNKEAGLNCLTIDDFSNLSDKYDIIIINHVIEHLLPNNVLEMFNTYIAKLSVSGILIITTPVYTKLFYLDFDHIRPYPPLSLLMIFNDSVQIQYQCNFQMNLDKTVFIKVPYNHRLTSTKGIDGNNLTNCLKNIIYFLIFFLSLCSIGKRTSWIGVFSKQAPHPKSEI